MSTRPLLYLVIVSTVVFFGCYISGTFVSGRIVDEKRGMSQPPREITLEAQADSDFAQFLPKDARYRVTEWEVTLARGARPIEQKRVSGPTANLQSFVPKASWRSL